MQINNFTRPQLFPQKNASFSSRREINVATAVSNVPAVGLRVKLGDLMTEMLDQAHKNGSQEDILKIAVQQKPGNDGFIARIGKVVSDTLGLGDRQDRQLKVKTAVGEYTAQAEDLIIVRQENPAALN